MKKKFELAYGNGALDFELPGNIRTEILLPRNIPPIGDPVKAMEDALANPVGTPPLLEMLKTANPQKIVVVVNDETRPTPYGLIFPPLLEVFKKAGIKDDQVVFVIATGIHAPHSNELNEQIYGKDITGRFKFVSHVSTDASSLVDIGKTPSGYDCLINRLAVEADFLITIGVVMPHYFAGFSGGRKSILPGLAGHETVAKNHARMVELLDALPSIDENPVSMEMIEVARRVGVDFIINTVTDDKGRLIAVFAGDLVDAWRKAVSSSASMYEVPFDEQADITIASACGYPRDVNVYQAQKALDHAMHITRPGGTIIWVGKCQSGFGEDVFVKWLNKKLPPRELMARFRENFELGGHKAYAIASVCARNEVILISDMTDEETGLMFARKEKSLQKAVNDALAKFGEQALVAILPQACTTLPVKK